MSIEPSRRSVIKAGAWSAPLIVSAAAVPAFAASPGPDIVTTRTISRSSNEVTQTGTLTNSGSASTVVTLTVIMRCDTTGAGAGTTNSLSITFNGWARQETVFLPNNEGWRSVTTRDVPASTTVPLPTITLGGLNPASTTEGTITTSISAPSPARTENPSPLRWGAFAGRPVGNRNPKPDIVLTAPSP